MLGKLNQLFYWGPKVHAIYCVLGMETTLLATVFDIQVSFEDAQTRMLWSSTSTMLAALLTKAVNIQQLPEICVSAAAHTNSMGQVVMSNLWILFIWLHRMSFCSCASSLHLSGSLVHD